MAFSLIKKPAVYISIVTVAALVVGYVLLASPGNSKGETVTVVKGNITQSVSVTGTVEASRKVSLSFDRSGSIKSLPYPVGTTVSVGAVLASLQNEAEVASIAESDALVAIAEAKLAKIHEGTRSEEINLKEAEVRKAEVALKNTESGTSAVLSDAYSAAEEAINRYADPFFSADDTTTPKLTYSSGTQESYDAEAQRLKAGLGVKEMRLLLGGTPSITALEKALEHLRVVQQLFITLGLTLRDGNTLESSLLTDYRSRVTTARAALTDAVTLVQDHLSTLRGERAELDRTESALLLAKAKATPETVKEAEQELLQAQAKLLGSRASFEKTLLRAPFNGKVASRHVEVGESVSGSDKVLELLSTSGYIIEANVSEANITKITEGDKAGVTLDAYGSDTVFDARVSSIEPSSTEVEGVSTYKTTFSIDDAATTIRSGMTANITMHKILKEGVLIVPTRALTLKDGMASALRVVESGQTEEVLVTLGAQSGAGEVEIVSGLSLGDQILIPTAK